MNITKKKCLLHIGRHKSGTSSLQHFLSENAAVLATHEWIYPCPKDFTIHHTFSRHLNSRQMQRLPKPTQELLASQAKNFWEEASKHQNIIISSENFQNNDPVELKPFLEGFDLEIVIYFRELCSYLISSYAQAIKAQKITMSIEEYERTIFMGNYKAFIKKWETTFPDAKVTVRPFHRPFLRNGDIRHDFVYSTQLNECVPLSALTFRRTDQNPSIGGVLLEFKRCLNYSDSETLIKQSRLYNCLQKLASTYPEYNRNQSISFDLSNILKEKYICDTQYVETRIGISENTLFNPKHAKNSVQRFSLEEVGLLEARLEAELPGIGRKLVGLAREKGEMPHKSCN